jgi:hypothetical protein
MLTDRRPVVFQRKSINSSRAAVRIAETMDAVSDSRTLARSDHHAQIFAAALTTPQSSILREHRPAWF